MAKPKEEETVVITKKANICYVVHLCPALLTQQNARHIKVHE